MQGVVEYDMSSVRGPLANTFIVLINALFLNVKLIGVKDSYPKDYSESLLKEVEDEFDFIIVGAGSAGCSLANSLSEFKKWQVLLLEAGDYPTQTTEVPNLYPTLVGTPEDWYFQLEHDERACRSYVGSKCAISRGKVLGGTSTIGDLIYIRGLTDDYDSMAFESWGSNNTYTVFEKLENYNGSDSFGTKYGSQGPIKLEYTNYIGPPKRFLKDAYCYVGLKNLTHKLTVGYADFLKMTENNERKNMAKNFLTPIKDRYNLHFSTNSEVQGVRIADDCEGTALGVNVSIRGHRMYLKATKEVILTAGPINNAKLLLISGIGPRDYLQEKNIPLYADLSGVGQNLQFHMSVPLFVAFRSCKCEENVYSETDIIKETYDYIIHRTGDLSNTNINEFITFISTQERAVTLPNLLIRHQYFRIDDRRLVTWVEAMNYHPKIRTHLIRKNKQKSIIMFNLVLMRPLSRGQVLLNDLHHLGSPKIIPRFMSDHANMDYETLLSGFDFITNMTDIFKKEAEFLDLDIPNCRNFQFCTMSYVKCYIHNMATPNGDVVGTTAMGTESEESLAVVKENLEVRSVRHLRVADSSVLNTIPVGNTIATDAMIGFKMGEILKMKWETRYLSDYIPEISNDVKNEC